MRKSIGILKRCYLFISSYGLAMVVLFFLFVLTFLGTLHQVEHGLLAATNRYFSSFLVVEYLFGVAPVPLPGGYTLMTILFFNILSGAILRARKDWRRPGMLIAHSGILLMLLYGVVTNDFSIRGHMRLFEGESANFIQSYYDYELVITELKPGGRQFIVPPDRIAALENGGSTVFHSDDLPFDIAIDGFMPNCQPAAAGGSAQGVEGVILERLALDPQAEMNIAGVYAAVHPKEGGETQYGLLWGLDRGPWVVEAGGGQYALDLRHQRWEVPFTIVLEKFTRELHPRTGIASNFQSTVTQIRDNVGRQIEIKMNEPLRDDGFTFYQASWGPQDAGPNEPLFSVFEVTRNPAEQWPLYACIVVTIGLLIHFVQKLLGYLRSEARRRAAT